jgi:ferrous iron transport protein A
MTLQDCPVGSRLRLRRVTGAQRHRRRLSELGFVRGAVLSVIGRGAMGGLVLALGDARVAVDSFTAGTLVVEPADG